jgi:hypothetical protein
MAARVTAAVRQRLTVVLQLAERSQETGANRATLSVF